MKVEVVQNVLKANDEVAAFNRQRLRDAGVFCDRDDLDAWEQTLRRLLDGRRWKAASRKARARAAELDPAEDLARWCDEVETLARRRLRVRSRVAD